MGKVKAAAPAKTGDSRQNNKATKKRPQVFDLAKRRLVTKA